MAPTKPPPPANSASSNPRAKNQAKPRQQPLEFYETTSTGHQQGSGVSKPSSWRISRQGKINQQFRAKNPLASLHLAANIQPPRSSSSGRTTPGALPVKTKPTFDACHIYISGSTSPTISDHRLKQLLSQNGAKICSMISRTTTTHVIVGDRGVVGAGAGGGLAAGKVQKEIAAKKPGACALKYVNVQWAMESLRDGKKMAESAFRVVEAKEGAQRGIMAMLGK